MQLLQELWQFFPDDMLPSKLVLMDKLPKNSNGKVNRSQQRAMLG